MNIIKIHESIYNCPYNCSKCVSKAIRSEAFEALTPLQLGVGVSVGCESIVHAVNCVLEDSSIKPEEVDTSFRFFQRF